jgi:beta-galactosidase/beta-glucuronidase
MTTSPVKLHTRWAKEMDPENPLPEYPRPQMVRDSWINLNGLWQYAVTPKEQEKVPLYDGKILVPFPIESSLSGVQQPLLPNQRLWYQRNFFIPEDWQGQRILLHFGAVDWETTVWCNGTQLGIHQGGYDPFSFELTDLVNIGQENELVVAVWDPTDAGRQERGKQVLEPKFVMYTAVSGIWQTVWLEAVPQEYITGFNLTPDIGQNQLTIRVDVETNDDSLLMEATAWDGETLINQTAAPHSHQIVLSIPDAKWWTPDNPHLYDLTLRLKQRGKVIDEVKTYFGLRQISLEKDDAGTQRLCLNHKPLFQYGPLDQGYWPDGLYTAPLDEALIYDIEFCKSLGMNMIRKHIKVEPARWYYHCDRLGMMVWQDMPNGGKVPHMAVLGMGFLLNLKLRDNKNYQRFGREEKQVRENYRRELKAMIDTLYNHPCIVVWVPFNESWGQFDAKAIGNWVKTYDPSRLVDAASGWFDQGNGDIYSIHKYVGPASPKPEKNRAVALSEFGGIGLEVPGHTWPAKKLFAYKMVKSTQALTDWYLKLMEKLEKMKDEGLSAAIYTELCDVEYEINGYLTYDREVMKMDIEKLREAHQKLINA